MATAGIKLNFSRHTRIAGQNIEGSVDLNLRAVNDDGIENVRVKLRGKSITKFKTSTSSYRQSLPLLREDLVLWSRPVDINQFPNDPNSNTISIPFRFKLPDYLPSTFFISAPGKGKGNDNSPETKHPTMAKLAYSIQVVGEKPGMFKMNKRLPLHLFGVVSKGERSVIELRRILIQERGFWRGGRKTYEKRNIIKQGFFSGQAETGFQISLPSVREAFPMGSPIPYSLTITTLTKPFKLSQMPSLIDAYNPNSEEVVFPAFSASPKAFSLSLGYTVDVTVESMMRKLERQLNNAHVACLAGESNPGGESSYTIEGGPRSTTYIRREGLDLGEEINRIQVYATAPEWKALEGKEGKSGRWKREVRFEGIFLLPQQTPTFKTQNINCSYFLKLKVPFAGKGNDLEESYPITIGSAYHEISEASAAPRPVQNTGRSPVASSSGNDSRQEVLTSSPINLHSGRHSQTPSPSTSSSSPPLRNKLQALPTPESTPNNQAPQLPAYTDSAYTERVSSFFGVSNEKGRASPPGSPQHFKALPPPPLPQELDMPPAYYEDDEEEEEGAQRAQSMSSSSSVPIGKFMVTNPSD